MRPSRPSLAGFVAVSFACSVASAGRGPSLDDLIPVGSEFRVHDFTDDEQTRPDLDLAPDGDFVVTWRSYEQDGELGDIFARRYSSSGQPREGEFRISGTFSGQWLNKEGSPMGIVRGTWNQAVSGSPGTYEGILASNPIL